MNKVQQVLARFIDFVICDVEGGDECHAKQGREHQTNIVETHTQPRILLYFLSRPPSTL